jgi:hypothetical protein
MTILRPAPACTSRPAYKRRLTTSNDNIGRIMNRSYRKKKNYEQKLRLLLLPQFTTPVTLDLPMP